jgi:bifunctional non-homologous end joining protein LigD
MALEEYKRKRNFTKTPEPAGEAVKSDPKQLRYVIQKHAARQMHYDFRLELDGVLLSWAVPRGPSFDPKDRRLAVHVEDHPVEYGEFEGIIPKGEYGGGTVMLWDRGWWEPEYDPHKSYAKGHLQFTLHGEKLHGSWHLVRSQGRREGDRQDPWFLIKRDDATAMPGHGTDIVDSAVLSVASGRDMAAIAVDGDRTWHSKGGRGEVKAKPRLEALPFNPGRIKGAECTKELPKLTPQLPSAADRVPAGDDWLHEIKYDGYRLLVEIRAGKVTLRTRTGLDWTARFPAPVQAIEASGIKDALLDGEIVHLLPSGVASFGDLQNDLSEGRTGRLTFMFFDLLAIDGWDLTTARLEDRKGALEQLVAALADERLRYSDHQVGRGPDIFASAQRLGLEGIVSKRRDALYRPGRGSAWVKSKCIATEELIVVGYTDPGGARAGFGALLLGYHTKAGKLTYAGRVGTGFSDKQLTALTQRLKALERKTATVKLPEGLSARGTHWVAPEIVIEISFADWSLDGILRHSRFVGVREDTTPEEVVLDPQGRDGPAVPTVVKGVIGRDGSAMVAGIKVSHVERAVYPDKGITKLAVAEYYGAAAGHMLPHVAGRPLSLLRSPDGLGGKGFFQKNLTSGFPDEIGRCRVTEKDGSTIDFAMVEDVKGLVALVQMGVLEIHPWGSRAEDLEHPDRLIFDLDPDETVPWERVVSAAMTVRRRLEDLGLRSFPKTTGGKGLHLVVPIQPELDWTRAKAFTKAVVERLEAEAPTLYTASMAIKARRGRIFIDYLRNGRGSTAVGAYSTRAKPAATVSTPLTWEEVESGIRADHFTIDSLPRRLESLSTDPWADLTETRQRISSGALKHYKL